MHALLHDFLEITVLGSEIGQLPKTRMETHTIHLFQHRNGIPETVFGELIVTLPVHVEPSGVKVNHIRRDAVLTEFVGDIQAFLLREIGDATHPRAESPKRQHGRLARDIGIFIKNLLGFAEEKEQIYLLVAHKQAGSSDIRSPEITGDGG